MSASMDNKTRAEKIVRDWRTRAFSSVAESHHCLISSITSQLDEVVREALERRDKQAISCSHCSGTLQSFQAKWYRGCLCECHVGTYEDAFNEGFAAAREKAAGIVEEYRSDSIDWIKREQEIADRIRAMEADK